MSVTSLLWTAFEIWGFFLNMSKLLPIWNAEGDENDDFYSIFVNQLANLWITAAPLIKKITAIILWQKWKELSVEQLSAAYGWLLLTTTSSIKVIRISLLLLMIWPNNHWHTYCAISFECEAGIFSSIFECKFYFKYKWCVRNNCHCRIIHNWYCSTCLN